MWDQYQIGKILQHCMTGGCMHFWGLFVRTVYGNSNGFEVNVSMH